MIKFSMTDIIKNTIYRYQRFFITYFTLTKQVITLQFKVSRKIDKVAFIYVMSHYVYIHMALICISSFIYHNNNFEVRIYCDKKLYLPCKLIRLLLHRQVITIYPLIESDSDPMLEQVVMFIKTSGSNSILMDADMRWTDTLQYNFQRPLVYNKEENQEHQEMWKLFSSYLNLEELVEFTMYTCCITSLGEQEISYKQSEIDKILGDIKSFDWTQTSSIAKQKHIRGQFIISYLLSSIRVPPISVIEIQEKQQKKFLETSFYGATGYRFGK